MTNQKPSTYLIGIDLGTTNTVISSYGNSGQPQVIPNLDGNSRTPSVVYYPSDGSGILVGDTALNMTLVDPKHVVFEAKRHVGTGKVFFTIGGEAITPERVQADILAFEIRSAREYTGDPLAGSEIVVTIPAFYGEKERQSVRYSAQLAGVKDVRFINEPTAAGLAYGLNNQKGDAQVLVLDFGGGTFDASIIQYSGGEATVLATAGDRNLGGKDVDGLFLELFRYAFENQHGLKITPESHPADCYALREEVIRQKHLLASKTEVKFVGRIDGKTAVLPVDRTYFAAVCEDLMTRVEKVIRDVIDAGKVVKEDLSILLVGGSSRLYPFQETIKRLFGADAIVAGQVSPDLAIAEGACIYAARTAFEKGAVLVDDSGKAIPPPRVKNTDVMSHSLGVGAVDGEQPEPKCSVILERNLPIPAKGIKMYGSTSDHQSRFQISVLQGEEGQSEAECLPVADRILKLPPRDPNQPSIEVTMGYDADGLVRVMVRDLVSGKTEDITTNFYPQVV